VGVTPPGLYCLPGLMKKLLCNTSVSVTPYHRYYSKLTSFHHSLRRWRSVECLPELTVLTQ